MVSRTQSGVPRKNAVVFAVESAVEEIKTGLGGKNSPIFLPDIAAFPLESPGFIALTGAPVSAMGTRIPLIAARNAGRVVVPIKADGYVSPTGAPVSAKGTRIALIAERNAGRVGLPIKTDA